ncbi:ABC transporter family substrate-binding protein [Arcanobacterium phocisimile]|uniref:ABC transporter family substrate-binding protein n=1 Tax=Arcanobacterium phocisimile TaxID=1302235 RepID=A0ABX7IJ56_9ACTO|nr:ABC transporter family substrate-binding protein [Arcanobacterium phocisimile]QRV01883.1 ABC transporter family substrate-binding protein [Arcanobacterium phocisimile]
MGIKKAGFALVAASALVLSACSGPASSESGSDGKSASLPASDYNKVDPADLKDGGDLRLAIASMPSNYNPLHVNGNTVENSDIWSYALGSNFIYADDATWEPNKNFLESYDVDTKADGDAKMTVTLNLNPEAKWYSETPITVADYQAGWNACKSEDTGFDCASTDGWNRIISIEQGRDEFQVIAKFDREYPDWSSVLGTAYPAAGFSDPAMFNDGWTDDVNVLNQFVSGPFKFKSIDNGAKRITLERNEKWWGDTAKLDAVTFSVLDTKAQAQAFANNELDIVDQILDAPTYELVKGRQNAEVKQSASTSWRHITLNSNAESLSDVKVRQAIQKGIDSADFLATDMAGLPVEGLDLSLGNHFFMPGQAGYEDHAVKFDPEGAMKDLEDLGYTMNESTKFFEKDGKPLSFNFTRLTGIPASESAAALLKEHMKAIGINVVFVDTPPKEFSNVLESGEFEAISFGWRGTPYPMANVGQIYGPGSSSNFSKVDDPKIAEYIEKIASETDNDKRVKLTNEVDEIIWDNVMTIPLYYRATLRAIPGDLANYGATAFETFLPEHIGYTK